jgi:hypothetical protein
MDLSYGPEYDVFREEVKSFLADNWPLKGDEAKGPIEEQARTFVMRSTEAGYLLRWIPREYGGSEQEADDIKATIIREEYGRAKAPMEPRGIDMMMLVPTLLERGEEWQKDMFIPKSVTGRVGDQRPEDLDHQCHGSGLHVLSRPHRARRPEARRHLVPAHSHEAGWHRSAAAQADERRRGVQ